MTRATPWPVDPELDLVLERVVPVPPALVWAAWTEARHLREWLTPRPWTVAECEADPRPGGCFRFVMRSPEGKLFPNVGCFLEVVPRRRLVWTTALEANFRPTRAESTVPFHMTAVIQLAAQGKGTRYTAIVLHKDADGRRQHDAMGFHDGWGTALDQLVAHAATMRPGSGKRGARRG